MPLQKLKSQFENKFLSLIHIRNRYEVFRDWAYIVAITCHQAPVNMGIIPKDKTYERLENLYLERVKSYDSKSLQVFAGMLGIVQLVFGNGKTDFLGQLHQELSIGLQKDKGQFFTPYPVAKMTAHVTIDKELLDAQIKEKGYITVGEPTVGAGSLLIAAAERIEELGYDPRKHMYFQAVDIDHLCCDMAYIQMSVMGIPGLVIHGNTLSGEVWSTRATPNLQLWRRQKEVHPLVKLHQVFTEMGVESNNNSTPEQDTNTCQQTESFDITPRQLNLFDQEPSSSPINSNQNKEEPTKKQLKDKQLNLFEDL